MIQFQNYYLFYWNKLDVISEPKFNQLTFSFYLPLHQLQMSDQIYRYIYGIDIQINKDNMCILYSFCLTSAVQV